MIGQSKGGCDHLSPPVHRFPLVLYWLGQRFKSANEEPKMTWETPEFVEVKMDAEINSYQDDFGGDRDTGV